MVRMSSLPQSRRREQSAPRTRAAVYVRVSSPGQEEDGTSLGTQEAACRHYAADQGLTLETAQVYREVFSGTELWQRPQLSRLRDAIRRREVDRLVCYAIDRLSRDPVHLGVIISEAEHAGVAVDFVSEPLDSSPEGQLIRFVRGYAAKVEHEKIRERIGRGKRARAQAGKLLHGPRPMYGYRWRDADKSTYAPDPATAPILQRIFREAAGGTTLGAIAAGLMRDGIPAPGGGRDWYRHTLSFLLSQPGYTGQAEAFRVRWTQQDGRAMIEDAPAEQRVPLPAGTIPALVDAELFAAVRERLQRNRAEAARNCAEPERYLLRAGYVRCGACGATAVVVQGSAAAPPRYRCASSSRPSGPCAQPIPAVRTSVLDAAAWTRAEHILTHPEVIAAELQRMMRDDPTQQDLETTERRLAEIDRQQRNLVDQLADLSGTVAGLVQQKLGSLESERQRLLGERQALLNRRQGWQQALERLDDIDVWCRSVAGRLGTLSYQEKRLALEALGLQAVIYGSERRQPRYRIEVGPSIADSTTTGSVRNLQVFLSWTDRDPAEMAAPAGV